jgi:N-acetylneuraminic acid mutarotase
MFNIRVILLAIELPFVLCWNAGAASPTLSTSQLPDLPNTVGVAGPFVGVAGDALVVGGGTNFPDAPPWSGGTKMWHDTAFVLTSPEAQWQEGFKLPKELAYGVSITTNDGLVCIGGCTATENVADVFVLKWDGTKLSHDAMVPLPAPSSCQAGVLIGSRIYLAGGQPGPNPVEGASSDYFWVLDLKDEHLHWKSLPTWPGPERFYAVAGTDGELFYLFSGIRRIVNADGQPALEYLRDAYCFDPNTSQWTRLPDLPNANAAVASPAPLVAGGLLLLGRGADGDKVDGPMDKRPGFSGDVLSFELASKKWESIGELPFGRAAVPSTQWHRGTVIASGEVGPGVRSKEVWWIK